MDQSFVIFSRRSNTWIGVGVGTSQWEKAQVFTEKRAIEYCTIRNADEANFFPVAVDLLRKITNGTR